MKASGSNMVFRIVSEESQPYDAGKGGALCPDCCCSPHDFEMHRRAPYLLLVSNLPEYLLLLLEEQRDDVLLAHLNRRRPSSFDWLCLDVRRR